MGFPAITALKKEKNNENVGWMAAKDDLTKSKSVRHDERCIRARDSQGDGGLFGLFYGKR